MNDYYQILEVEPNASQDQIKNQYRFLVQAWHPDKFGSPESKAKAEEKLKQINEAYNVLKDPVKREQYNHQRQYSQKKYTNAQTDYESQKREQDVRARAESGRQQREQAESQKHEQEARARAEAERRQREQAEVQRREQEAKARAEAKKYAREQAARKAFRTKLFAIVVLVIAILGFSYLLVGSWIVLKYISPVQMSKATLTQKPVLKITSTNSPILPTKTIQPSVSSIESLSLDLASTMTDVPATNFGSLMTEITDAKGVSMLVVQGAKFTMGLSAETALSECQKLPDTIQELYLAPAGCSRLSVYANQEPVQKVYVNTFYMDKFEVSNAAYRACVNTGACKPPTQSGSLTRSSYYGNTSLDDYPVIYVDLNMAKTYCEWRGAHIPSGSEWEKSARGTDGRLYPWGDTFDGTKTNFCDANCKEKWANKNYNDGYADTAPVNAFPSGVSMYGIFNLAGNVWEWVSDGNAMGGGWYDVGIGITSAFRFAYGGGASDAIGFRCARDANP